ncbi:hypothetical protein FisN_8Lh136 [Fistulifera solaris]|uniref:ATP-dependent (S)-NAD(P)H-hydrate dehydratase n=1 Tax=Fistulifera solaris TaxID=1519565 RepID=A0A1Z5JDL9_FISSO|nr:hypothetical protein FisN_8Lh136 [Fistulifera solaris]|eukprot:GAX12036.1 hypothetical protein FisN_8Lh136 [Fistulifera solaris]
MTSWDPRTATKVILPLSSDHHKGSSGRVGILGGNARYTGAPYYVAMACLKAGADLAYVLTAQEAALPIKCYSPELMVEAVYVASEFDDAKNNQQIEELSDAMAQKVIPSMERLHCLVIGPGLGRCPVVFRAVAKIVEQAKQQQLHLVFDADALYMLSLSEYRNLLRGYHNAVLTPNVVEYKRLFENADKDDSAFDAVTIIQKGQQDKIMHGKASVIECAEEGGLKRSGGIGDILAGTVGTLVSWHAILKEQDVADVKDLPLACWTACCFEKQSTT